MGILPSLEVDVQLKGSGSLIISMTEAGLAVLDGLWRSVDTQDLNLAERLIVRKIAAALNRNSQTALVSSKADDAVVLGINGFTVIDVEITTGVALVVKRNEELEGVLAGFGGGVCRLLHGEDVAATDIDGDVAERSRDGDLAMGHGFSSVPIVPAGRSTAGEDTVNRGNTRVKSGDNHQARTKEELRINGSERLVIGELPAEGTHDGGT